LIITYFTNRLEKVIVTFENEEQHDREKRTGYNTVIIDTGARSVVFFRKARSWDTCRYKSLSVD